MAMGRRSTFFPALALALTFVHRPAPAINDAPRDQGDPEGQVLPARVISFVLEPSMLALPGPGPSSPASPPVGGPLPSDPRAGAAAQRRMAGHFDGLLRVATALIFGDLDAARDRARGLVDLTAPPGASAWEPRVARIRDAAARLTRTHSAARARRLASGLAAGCGECHLAAGAVPSFPWAPEPEDDGSSAARMARHRWASERIWEGLVSPSDDRWREGLDALAEAPLLPDAFGGDRGDYAAVERLGRRLQQAAARARRVDGQRPRADAFAAIMQVCAGCHALARR